MGSKEIRPIEGTRSTKRRGEYGRTEGQKKKEKGLFLLVKPSPLDPAYRTQPLYPDALASSPLFAGYLTYHRNILLA
jgi:hypothetical protein